MLSILVYILLANWFIFFWLIAKIARTIAAFQQMFPISAEKSIDRVKSLTESYHKYKREYVQHLGFNPDNKNLSK